MADLSTAYMGLSLRNPLIVASCSLVNNLDGVRRCVDAGAGAVHYPGSGRPDHDGV